MLARRSTSANGGGGGVLRLGINHEHRFRYSPFVARSPSLSSLQQWLVGRSLYGEWSDVNSSVSNHLSLQGQVSCRNKTWLLVVHGWLNHAYEIGQSHAHFA